MDMDFIVIGGGAGGGVAACVLAEAGKQVILLERGPWRNWANTSRDHVRNQRFAIYGHNSGPDVIGNPRVYVDPQGGEHLVAPHEAGFHNNAAGIGGGTVVYGAQAWRFMPDDFRMASRYGVPPGSSLADWPITYEDLAPHYERAEWEIGVCGDGRAGHSHTGARRRGYPMPPVPDNPSRSILRQAADRLGWHSTPLPLLINSVPYNGRAACVQCGSCVGFACPSDGKNGTQNTVIPRALATGNCTVIAGAMVERIDTDERGKVIGVTYFTSEGQRVVVRAKAVIAAGGAIETARLLLNSRSSDHPNGLGNHSGQLGRHLQGHYYPSAVGQFRDIVNNCEGPGVSIATCQFNHGNPGIIGGAMLANEFVKMPIMFWRNCFPPGIRNWGLEAKQYMRENYLRVIQIQGPVQEIPSPDSRVTVDPQVRDRWGIPVARLSGTTHPQTVRTAEFMRQKCEQWLAAAGARRTWKLPLGLSLSAGQHQSGTCRMGHDPADSVTDSLGKVHGHDNLFIADASLHVTNGGFNPVLTIMALAFRVAGHAAELT